LHAGVDAGLIHHPADNRVSDISPNKFNGQARWRRDGVDADDPIKRWICSQNGGEPAAEIARDTGHQSYSAHGHLPALRTGLLLVTALDSRATQQLAVLLLSHPLATLLDH
jgi:hypothetical protein